MFTSVVITVCPQSDLMLQQTMGYGLYAAFLHLVGLRNGRLADKLHAPTRSKPFTVSPLYGDFVTSNGVVHLQKEQHYWFRLTSLDPTLSALLADLTPVEVPAVTLFSKPLPVIAIAKSPEEHPWASHASAEVLYERHMLENDPPHAVTLQFNTPTTFRSGGQNIPFPLPRFVFLTLGEKWNHYAPVHLGDDVAQVIADRVLLSRYDLKTRMFDFGRYRQVGFTGQCEFRIDVQDDDLWGRVVHLLADFAFYAGVGYKATMGMGQTRRM